jgi:hypothetical protein
MEYGRLKMLKSDPVVEPTAVTMRSIKEILEETGGEDLLLESSKPAPAAAPVVQRTARPAPKPRPVVQPGYVPAASGPTARPDPGAVRSAKPGHTDAPPRPSFGQRLAARLFGTK